MRRGRTLAGPAFFLPGKAGAAGQRDSGAGVPIYIDESGSLPAGVMTMAGVEIGADDAVKLLQRYRAVTGLRGELKGSRIELLERAYFFELLERFGGRAQVCLMRPRSEPGQAALPRDLDCYVALLDALVTGWQAGRDADCLHFVIDQGRYDALVLEDVRQDVARLIAHCGSARMVDSRRSAGVQIADVIANSAFSIATDSRRSGQVRLILEPFLQSGLVRMRTVAPPPAPAPKMIRPALQGSTGRDHQQ